MLRFGGGVGSHVSVQILQLIFSPGRFFIIKKLELCRVEMVVSYQLWSVQFGSTLSSFIRKP